MQLPERGPRHLPLLGHLPQLALDPIKFLSQLPQRYGDVVPLRIGVSKALFINRPELIQQLLRDRNCYRSEESRIGIRSFLGNGLLASEGPGHLRHRRLMAPAFHRERFREYGALMCDETYQELASWDRATQTRDVREDMSRLTFAIVAKALFSTGSTGSTDGETAEVCRALQEVLPWMLLGAALAGVAPWLPVMYPPHARKALKKLKQLVRDIIARRRREGGDRGDLLSMLLAARDEDGGSMSDADVCDETLTLLMAGHDTTASTMTWALHLLAQNPQLQAAVADQVLAATENGQGRVTTELLSQMPLVRQVIDETLRMFPVVWVGDRTPQRPLTLGPYTIPAGFRVLFAMFVTQRDARYFPDPERFDPSRFAPERVKQIPDGAYMPFGGGVHLCIGNHFALMEAQVILAALLQRFTFSSVPKHRVRLDPQVVLSPHGALPMIVRERSRSTSEARPYSHVTSV